MATHSSVLAWRIPGAGEPGGLPSMGLHRVGHDWSDLAAAAAAAAFSRFPPKFNARPDTLLSYTKNKKYVNSKYYPLFLWYLLW